MTEEFRDSRTSPSDILLNALYDRFRPFKINKQGEDFYSVDEVDVLNLMLGLNLLSRNSLDKKIKCKY